MLPGVVLKGCLYLSESLAWHICYNGANKSDSFIRHPPPSKAGSGNKMKETVTAIGFVALLLGCLAVELISEENMLPLSFFTMEPFVFLSASETVNHFLNSFQVIKTLPGRVCWTSKFSFNCLASVSLMDCGHPRDRSHFSLGITGTDTCRCCLTPLSRTSCRNSK